MLEYIYQSIGLLLIAFAVQTFMDSNNAKRFGTGAFWFIYGLSFCLGKFIPDWITGLMVLSLTLLAAGGFMGTGNYNQTDTEFKKKSATQLQNKLFIPALIVPLGTILWSLFTSHNVLIGLGLSSFIAIIVAMMMTKVGANQSLHEGRRLIDAIGWAAILSQFLAALGYLFGQAGVGTAVSELVMLIVPDNNLLAYVFVYTFGMALFTMVMGNAFAAFAVITAGIGIPLLMAQQGGNPAIIGVLGMVSGYCGTLMTPMAANFNMVPAALLELENKNHIIKIQAAPAIAMLFINSILMYWFAF